MADRLDRLVEMECADVLLDSGVSVPLKRWKLPFRKRPVELRVRMRCPRLGDLIRLSRECLRLGVDPRREPEDGAEGMAFMAEHGKGVSRLLALAVCRGRVSRRLGIGLTAWMLRELVDWKYLLAAFRTFVRLTGTGDFMRIISSVDRMSPLKPRLSRERKGS